MVDSEEGRDPLAAVVGRCRPLSASLSLSLFSSGEGESVVRELVGPHSAPFRLDPRPSLPLLRSLSTRLDVAEYDLGLRDIHKDPISGDEDHLAYLKQKLESCKYDFEEAYLYSDRKNQTLPQRTYKTNLGEALRPQWGAGIWPPMREVLQNAIDHLSLTDKHGLRHQHVKTDFAESADGVKVLHFYIECASEPEYHVSLLKISFVGEDKIRFWQSHTYPLHPNTLVKGMRDMLKENNNSQVGGFGYGMKDMFREILHRDESAVTYRMWGNDKEYAEWNVKTEPPPSVRGAST